MNLFWLHFVNFLSLLISLVGSILSPCVLFRTIYKNPSPQKFMIKIILVLWFCQLTYLTVMILIICRQTHDSAFYELSSMLSQGCWLCIIWTLSFKYWQTAYELNYLFRSEDESRNQRQMWLYLGINMIGYGLQIIPVVSYWVLAFEDKWDMTIIPYCFVLMASCFSIGFFIAGQLRMNKVIKRMPKLKQSEKFFQIAMIFIIIQVLGQILNLIWTQVLLNDSKHDLQNLIDVYATMTLSQNIMGALFCVLIFFIGLKLTQPPQDLKDKNSGKNMSLLIFIKSKYDMRKIFNDDDDDLGDSGKTQRDLEDSIIYQGDDVGTYIAQPQTDFALNQSSNTLYNNNEEQIDTSAELRLREQILYQMLQVDQDDE